MNATKTTCCSPEINSTLKFCNRFMIDCNEQDTFSIKCTPTGRKDMFNENIKENFKVKC